MDVIVFEIKSLEAYKTSVPKCITLPSRMFRFVLFTQQRYLGFSRLHCTRHFFDVFMKYMQFICGLYKFHLPCPVILQMSFGGFNI